MHASLENRWRFLPGIIALVVCLAAVPAPVLFSQEAAPAAEPPTGAPAPAPEPSAGEKPSPPALPEWVEQRFILEEDGLVTLWYRCHQPHNKMLEQALPRWLSKNEQGQPVGFAFAPPDTNLIIVKDRRENMNLVRKLIEILDRPEPQIKIEAQVVERTITSDLDIGIQAGEGAGLDPNVSGYVQTGGAGRVVREFDASFNPEAFLGALAPGALPFQGATIRFFSLDSAEGNLDLRLRSLIARGEAKVLSSPSVSVTNGHKARIESSVDVPYQVQIPVPGGSPVTGIEYKKASIVLEVLPSLIGSEFVELDLFPQVTSVSGFRNVGAITAPELATRSANTKLVVRSGEQIYVGGLVREEDLERERGIPLLADIPLIGYLFKSYRHQTLKTEIIFIIRPSVFDPLAKTPSQLLVPPPP